MGFESKLFSGVRKLHDQVHDKPFIAQYSQGKVTLIDHYRHLQQLEIIYCNIENMLKNPSFNYTVPLELQELVERRRLIASDMSFLERHIPPAVKRAPLANNTLHYIHYLQKFKMEYDETSDVLLAHFLVRILGDLSGGQSFKEYIKTLYKKEGLIKNSDSNEGVAFYEFSEEMHKKCARWLDTLTSGEHALHQDETRMKRIINFANESFDIHIKIFDELYADQPRFSMNKPALNGSCFFAQPTVLAATAVAATAAVIALNVMW